MKFLLDQGIPRSLKDNSPSVIRIENLKAIDYLKLIKRILPEVKESLLGGALVSIREDSIGIRKLPI